VPKIRVPDIRGVDVFVAAWTNCPVSKKAKAKITMVRMNNKKLMLMRSAYQSELKSI